MKIYRFRVDLVGLEGITWREIEVLSDFPLTKLAYTVLATFDCEAANFWNIKVGQKRYEIEYEDVEYTEELLDPRHFNISDLDMNEEIILEYDYKNHWKFNLKLLSITKEEDIEQSDYPRVIAGENRGIIEDYSFEKYIEFMREVDKQGKAIYNERLDYEWDYKDFDAAEDDELLRIVVKHFEKYYEHPHDCDCGCNH